MCLHPKCCCRDCTGTATHAPGTCHHIPAASQRPSPSARLGVFICLPFSLSPLQEALSHHRPARSGPVSCSILPGLPCFFLLPSPCPLALRPCLRFCLLPPFLSLPPVLAPYSILPERLRPEPKLASVRYHMSGLGQRVSRGHPADLLQDLCCQQPPRAPGERLFAAPARPGMLPHIREPVSPRSRRPTLSAAGQGLARRCFVWSFIPWIAPGLLAACSCPENPFPAFEIEDARAICVFYFLVETNKPRIASSP